MTREELTAIVAGIIQGVAVQGAMTRKAGVDMKDLVVECVDQAELLVMEAAKSPEQRAEERTAREVARKMTAEQGQEVGAISGTAIQAKQTEEAQRYQAIMDRHRQVGRPILDAADKLITLPKAKSLRDFFKP
jgi:hypothetical protein